MSILDFFKRADINQGIETYRKTTGAILLDVRTIQEYNEGHIPESKHVALQNIEKIRKIVKQKDTPLFVYCYSGSRSHQATRILKQMGYTNINNIGGIIRYKGKVVQ